MLPCTACHRNPRAEVVAGTRRRFLERGALCGIGNEESRQAVRIVSGELDGEEACIGCERLHPDTEPLARYLQERGEEIVSGADSVCLEMDMGEELSEWIVALCQKYRKDLYCISANMSVVQRRPDLLRHTRCFICNDIEAERLLHHPVSRADPEAAVETILHYGRGMGLRSMVVTLGSSGSVYYDSITGDAGHCPAHKVEMVDSTGAGDAFFSGVVSGLTRGLSLGRAVAAGTRLAALTIQSDEACCPSLPDFWEEMRP